MIDDTGHRNTRRKEIDFDKYKPTRWRTFKQRLVKMLNFRERGGIWVYLPALLLYPLALLFLFTGIYYNGVKAVPRVESENLLVYSIRRDVPLAKEVAEYLEPYSIELKSLLGLELNKPTEVVIHRSMKEYRKKVFELAPRWSQTYSRFVTSELGDIEFISTNSKDIEALTWYDMEYIKRNAKVSLGQEYLNSANYNYRSLPIWLSEGVPFYLVADETDIESVKAAISNSVTPQSAILKMDLVRSNLFTIVSDTFTDSNGREYTYAMVDFLVQKYDEQTLINCVKDKKFTLSDVGYEDYDSLYLEWEAFLNENYRN